MGGSERHEAVYRSSSVHSDAQNGQPTSTKRARASAACESCRGCLFALRYDQADLKARENLVAMVDGLVDDVHSRISLVFSKIGQNEPHSLECA